MPDTTITSGKAEIQEHDGPTSAEGVLKALLLFIDSTPSMKRAFWPEIDRACREGEAAIRNSNLHAVGRGLPSRSYLSVPHTLRRELSRIEREMLEEFHAKETVDDAWSHFFSMSESPEETSENPVE